MPYECAYCISNSLLVKKIVPDLLQAGSYARSIGKPAYILPSSTTSSMMRRVNQPSSGGFRINAPPDQRCVEIARPATVIR
jgi:hypothetical protein